MSIALERSNNRVEGSGFMSGLSCNFDFKGTKVVEKREEELDSCSSSIGKNSDLSERSSTESDGEDETEVQSSYKGALDSLDALEEVLPIRRGISKFYCGKSKSFTSLADVSSSSSVKDLAKPGNAYTRKRKNLIACSIIWDKNRNSPPPRSNVGGISKRPTNSCRSTITVSGSASSFESNNDTDRNSNSTSSLTSRLLPPLHPQPKPSVINVSSSSSPPSRPNFSPWRSFSLADLQCATTTTNNTDSSSAGNKDEHEKLHQC